MKLESRLGNLVVTEHPEIGYVNNFASKTVKEYIISWNESNVSWSVSQQSGSQ